MLCGTKASNKLFVVLCFYWHSVVTVFSGFMKWHWVTWKVLLDQLSPHLLLKIVHSSQSIFTLTISGGSVHLHECPAQVEVRWSQLENTPGVQWTNLHQGKHLHPLVELKTPVWVDRRGLRGAEGKILIVCPDTSWVISAPPSPISHLRTCSIIDELYLTPYDHLKQYWAERPVVRMLWRYGNNNSYEPPWWFMQMAAGGEIRGLMYNWGHVFSPNIKRIWDETHEARQISSFRNWWQVFTRGLFCIF